MFLTNGNCADEVARVRDGTITSRATVSTVDWAQAECRQANATGELTLPCTQEAIEKASAGSTSATTYNSHLQMHRRRNRIPQAQKLLRI